MMVLWGCWVGAGAVGCAPRPICCSPPPIGALIGAAGRGGGSRLAMTAPPTAVCFKEADEDQDGELSLAELEVREFKAPSPNPLVNEPLGLGQLA